MDESVRSAYTWPAAIDTALETYLDTVGTIVRTFGERTDSRTRIHGVEVNGQRYVVKTSDDPEAAAWLRSAVRFHDAVRHQTIAALIGHIETPTGVALVEEWAPGEPLMDAFDSSRTPIHLPTSAFNRFRALPVETISRALQAIFDAHVAVAAAGFVAVDLYDGCVLYDFDQALVSLIDLDHYVPGPYVLDADRQIGSLSYMAPEELRRGATITERATVFALGRLAQVLMGCPRRDLATRGTFRGTDRQFELAALATKTQPEHRVSTVRQFSEDWRACG